MPIHILEPTVAAQIAAGEVVERPASVVKELIENALDAGARRISIEARGGGHTEVKIQDDGCGIAAADIETAFARHATSKLRNADDLWNIHTLGFRGEALPSIASVAQVICISRAAHEEVGTELRIAGGELQDRVPRGCSPGTSMSVRNLFYNTPVRREYLRSQSTEMSAISSVVQQYALAYPEVRFTLLLDGRLSLQTHGNNNLRDVLIEIYRLDVARQLLPLEAEYGSGEEYIYIQGMISPPGLTRKSRSYMHFFINRRAIQPRGFLPSVVEESYHTLLMKGQHPLVVLDIRVHPSAVDVNVHPTKSEVKFRYQQRVGSFLGRSIRQALIEGADVQTWQDLVATESTPRRFEVRQMETDAQTAPKTTTRGAPLPPGAAWGVGKRVWSVQHSRWDVGGGQASGAESFHGTTDVPHEETEERVEAPRDQAVYHHATHQGMDKDQYTLYDHNTHQHPVKGHTEGDAATPSSDAHGKKSDAKAYANRSPHDRETTDSASFTGELGEDKGEAEDIEKKPHERDATHGEQLDAEASHHAEQHMVATSKLPPLRVVGQVGLTYIVAESPNGMYLIDQHATHERIAYERLMAQRGVGSIESQELLMPQTVHLPPAAVELLIAHTDTLAEWGFTLDEWGEGMVRVRAIPALLLLEHVETALVEIVEHLGGHGGSTPDDWREAMLITLACHTSVRAGQALSLEEMRDLLQQLERCHNPHTCPHGRPIMVLLTPGQLERQFGRTG